MWGAIELSDVHNIVLILQHCCFVVIDVKVVRCRENGHNAGKSGSSSLSVHTVASILSFVGSDNREQIVLLQERASCRV